MTHAYHFNHEQHLQGGLGILPTIAYTIIKALLERGTFFRIQVYQRVRTLLVWVYEKVQKSVIFIYKKAQKGLQILQMHFMCVPDFMIFPCFWKTVHLQQLKGVDAKDYTRYVKQEEYVRDTICQQKVYERCRFSVKMGWTSGWSLSV